jgi:hypothetical protein
VVCIRQALIDHVFKCAIKFLATQQRIAALSQSSGVRFIAVPAPVIIARLDEGTVMAFALLQLLDVGPSLRKVMK